MHLRHSAFKPANVESADVSAKQDPSLVTNENFSMLLPPPNVTGNIHLGHALTATIQDVLIRWKQKQNIRTRWIRGADHAGIATQVVVEKILFKQQSKTRHDIGREDFLKEVWKWKNEKGPKITHDLMKLGTSCDWEREYFTMDDNLSNAVNEAFIRLFDRGLIYRDEALINWSCSLESAISDVEVENLEIHGKTEIAVPNYEKNVQFGVITNIAYKVVDSSEKIVVATTRPETILGDAAVAVHPSDSRYTHLRNAQLWHPFRKESIPLIVDESVDPEFGTGAVKITPAHDKNDFEVGKRHKLRNVQVINEKGFIVDGFEEFAGLPRFIAREKILHSLAELQLYRGSDFHHMILPICSRSRDVVEFLLRPQWFVNCKEMSRKAVEVVENGQLKINPQSFDKEWNRWLTNCRDWCISRQLWWGHQIPAYKITSENNETWIAAKSKEEAEAKFREKNPNITHLSIVRDQDVLDTWFSSGLLPFSVFNWPETNDEFKKFFPLSLMETGHDILFFWVARMVMLSMELTGQLPFKEILLHGIVCDSYGRKMSKSLGNVVAPDQIIHGASPGQLQRETESLVARGILSQAELDKSLDGQKKMFPFGIKESGIDALRFTLCSHNIKQHFIGFDPTDCFTNMKFFNKIYNATKFALSIAQSTNVTVKDIKSLDGLKLSEMDLWILSRLGKTAKIVKQSLDNYNFHLATAALKDFFYDDFCDVYVETTKVNRMKTDETAVANCMVLNTCIAVGMDYLEMFTPFFANELKPHLATNISICPEEFVSDEIEKRIETLLEICGNIREIKAVCRITRKIPAEIQILIKFSEVESFLRSHIENIKVLTEINEISMTRDAKAFERDDFIGISTAGHLCSIGIRTLNKSSNRVDSVLNKIKFGRLESELIGLMKIVSNDGYQKNAPEKVKQNHKERVSNKHSK